MLSVCLFKGVGREATFNFLRPKPGAVVAYVRHDLSATQRVLYRASELRRGVPVGSVSNNKRISALELSKYRTGDKCPCCRRPTLVFVVFWLLLFLAGIDALLFTSTLYFTYIADKDGTAVQATTNSRLLQPHLGIQHV